MQIRTQIQGRTNDRLALMIIYRRAHRLSLAFLRMCTPRTMGHQPNHLPPDDGASPNEHREQRKIPIHSAPLYSRLLFLLHRFCRRLVGRAPFCRRRWPAPVSRLVKRPISYWENSHRLVRCSITSATRCRCSAAA